MKQSDDIAYRLRTIHCAKDDLDPCGTCLPCQAADEIERLEHENAIFRKVISEYNRENRVINITYAETKAVRDD